MFLSGLRFIFLTFVVSASLPIWAASPHKEEITFTHTLALPDGFGVFVVGNHPDLGAWDVTKAVKLHKTTGNIWTGNIAVQAGAQLQYKFISRSTASDVYCNSINSVDRTDVQQQQVPPQPDAPYEGKTIYYHSSWTQAFILYKSGTNWINAPMTEVGPGRTQNERLYKISGIAEAGEGIEFVPNNNAGSWDNSPHPGYGSNNYFTPLDVFWLQDGHIFNYKPPATVSAPTITTRTVNSSYPEIPSRTIRIYLPRGYSSIGNEWRRYPVIYMHDGQNLFDPNTAFGGTEWEADETATREISQGRMRECIIVGIDNGSNRIREYLPPTDYYPAPTPPNPPNPANIGLGDKYGAFVINNVRPTLDFNYRTLNDRANTFTAGSSMGGVISNYFGRAFDVFGKIGLFSPAFWTCPNYMNEMSAGQKKEGLRVYLDWGTAEGSSIWTPGWNAYDIFLKLGYAANADLLHVIGCDAPHNEAAWRARLPAAFRYLLDIWDEPNHLAQKEYPPTLKIVSLNGSGATFEFHSLRGFSYDLMRTENFLSWIKRSESVAEQLPWAVRTIEETDYAPAASFWRLRTVTHP